MHKRTFIILFSILSTQAPNPDKVALNMQGINQLDSVQAAAPPITHGQNVLWDTEERPAAEEVAAAREPEIQERIRTAVEVERARAAAAAAEREQQMEERIRAAVEAAIQAEVQRSIEAEAAQEQAAKAAIQLAADGAMARTLALETEIAEQRRLVEAEKRLAADMVEAAREQEMVMRVQIQRQQAAIQTERERANKAEAALRAERERADKAEEALKIAQTLAPNPERELAGRAERGHALKAAAEEEAERRTAQKLRAGAEEERFIIAAEERIRVVAEEWRRAGAEEERRRAEALAAAEADLKAAKAAAARAEAEKERVLRAAAAEERRIAAEREHRAVKEKEEPKPHTAQRGPTFFPLEHNPPGAAATQKPAPAKPEETLDTELLESFKANGIGQTLALCDTDKYELEIIGKNGRAYTIAIRSRLFTIDQTLLPEISYIVLHVDGICSWGDSFPRLINKIYIRQKEIAFSDTQNTLPYPSTKITDTDTYFGVWKSYQTNVASFRPFSDFEIKEITADYIILGRDGFHKQQPASITIPLQYKLISST